MTYFVSTTDETDPEVHVIDVYIGDTEPEVPEGAQVKKFRGEVTLKSFLMKGEWDKATIYKSPECSQDAVDELADWMNVNMSLENVITVCEDQGGRT